MSTTDTRNPSSRPARGPMPLLPGPSGLGVMVATSNAGLGCEDASEHSSRRIATVRMPKFYQENNWRWPELSSLREPLLLPMIAITCGVVLGQEFAFTMREASVPCALFALLALFPSRLRRVNLGFALLFAGAFLLAFHR